MSNRFTYAMNSRPRSDYCTNHIPESLNNWFDCEIRDNYKTDTARSCRMQKKKENQHSYNETDGFFLASFEFCFQFQLMMKTNFNKKQTRLFSGVFQDFVLNFFGNIVVDSKFACIIIVVLIQGNFWKTTTKVHVKVILLPSCF